MGATDYVERLRYEADIGDLKAKWAAMETGSKATADEVSSHGGLMSRGWEGFKGTLSTVIGSLAKVATLGAGGLAALGGYGLKAAGDFQQTRIAFEGLLGSAETADTFLKQMRDFAAKTPFELPGVLDAAKQLMATGTSAENVVPVLTKIGNVASALGVGEENIKSVVVALGQMKGKGKASAEEMNQIGEAIPGFSAVKAVAEGMGVSVADAFKAMEKGAVPADDAIKYILAGMEKFPGAAGAMDRQSRTLNGVISTLKDTFNNALIDGIEPFLPAMAKFGESLAPMMGKVVTFAVGGLKTFIGGIAETIRGIRAMVAAFRDGGDDVTSSGFAGVLERAGLIARNVFDVVIGIARRVIPVIGHAIESIRTSFGLFVGALKSGLTEDEVATPVERLAFILRDAFELIERTVRQVWPVLQDIVTGAITVVVAVLPVLRDALLGVGEALVGSIGWVMDHRELVIGILTALGVLVAGIVVPAMIGWAVAAASAAASMIILYAPIVAGVALFALLVAGIIYAYEHWGWFKAAVDAVASFLTDTLWPILKAIGLWIGEHFVPTLQWLAHIITDYVVPAFVWLYNWIKDDVIPIIVAIAVHIGNFVADAVRLFGEFNAKVTEVKDWIFDKFDAVVGFVTGLPDRIRQAASGMWDGIKDAFRGALNWIIGQWNGLEFRIPGFDPPGPGPTFPGFTLGLPYIHPLARGGLITRPTLALLGETAQAVPEIASPAPLMRQIVREELARTGSSGPLIAIGTYAGRDVATVDELERMAERTMFAARVGAAS